MHVQISGEKIVEFQQMVRGNELSTERLTLQKSNGKTKYNNRILLKISAGIN